MRQYTLSHSARVLLTVLVGMGELGGKPCEATGGSDGREGGALPWDLATNFAELGHCTSDVEGYVTRVRQRWVVENWRL